MTEHLHNHHHEHIFFFGLHRLHTPHEAIRVVDLKAIIGKHVQGFDPKNTLVLEESGDRPDKPLRDDNEIRICDFPHFYDQPPANFG